MMIQNVEVAIESNSSKALKTTNSCTSLRKVSLGTRPPIKSDIAYSDRWAGTKTRGRLSAALLFTTAYCTSGTLVGVCLMYHS